ncbi:UNVERIFIED_CONTAM: CRAL-TRIO domain-containing protein C23B6.04c [Sesamum radiatum]|uniref:CRAL-TRIO domain-containing protein C23B6.04c n=1 Tax=Sesamum radiatum TaxID=300843 RepID=A0AAW2TKN2_SESRA
MQSTDDVAGCHHYKKRKKMSAKKPQADVPEKCMPNEVEQAKSLRSEIKRPFSLKWSGGKLTWSLYKINELRKLISPVANKFPCQCSDTLILRFLRARNLNTKKAAKTLKENLKWGLEYKPEKIQWDDIAQKAETGKVYRANTNTKTVEGQIKYLVYCMKTEISDLDEDVDQMVWLIDFEKWNMSCIMKATRGMARLLQDHYPQRLGIAILHNPPEVFESFWLLVKPFLELKTYKKVKFMYSDQPQSTKVMESLLDMDKLEPAFGGKSKGGFDYKAYAKRMKNEKKQKSNELMPSA